MAACYFIVNILSEIYFILFEYIFNEMEITIVVNKIYKFRTIKYKKLKLHAL